MTIHGRAPAPTIEYGSCLHLGLKDDPPTCLAFASNWNYCHHALPPESVKLEHQRQFCQTKKHVQCPVFQKDALAPLPRDVRGRHVPKSRRAKSQLLRPLTLTILALAAGTIWFGVASGLLGGLRSQWLGTAPPAGPPGTAAAPASATAGLPTLAFMLPPVLGTSTSQPTAGIYPSTHEYMDPSPSTPTPVSTAAGVCGHQLDVPFGPGPQFIIHRVGGGDSLNRYEIVYNTSVAAIEGINLPYQIPVRADWVLVIPLDTTEVGDLPAFKPYLVSYRNTPIQTMAFKVSADLLAFEKYNGFDESCRDFIGWVLAPFQKLTP